jgi:hypothetical protein
VHPDEDLAAGFIIDYYHHLAQEDSYPRKLKALCNTTAPAHPLAPGDVGPMIEALKAACEKYQEIREAFIAEDPYMTVITTLFSHKATLANYRSKVFSTTEAAINWLRD